MQNIEKALRLGAADLSEVDLRMQGFSGKSVSANSVDTNFLGKIVRAVDMFAKQSNKKKLNIKETSTNNR